jgi:hypothetical protein
MTTREGVEIDYCPQCRGIWLDRGELDKLIDRSLRLEQSARSALDESAPKAKRDAVYDDEYERRPQQPAPRQRYDDDDDYRSGDGRYKKRKGFLGEIFDIFD